ncbi:alpha/beta fold hydrolase [Prauserella halophila]|uniref:Alpha/beta fold hydrolase n=1 Tax=Prauserella halophila TaxID=185641 RepID=A0ABN1W5L9_9PSEU|nr:alpha/beta fold hydrolase [Prauserella halophila]MCP2235746.1 pyochelin biosynthetic protein PchC [Prauserella halophila]
MAAATGDAGGSAWIRTHSPRPDASTNLVILPHAGGSANYYRSWGQALPGMIETHTVQYPGREQRFAEPPVRSMAALADAVAAELVPLFGRRVVLFGHSMGASLMYEVAKRCEADGRAPALLLASGHAAPHRRTRTDWHRRSDAELVGEVQRLADDGAPALDDPELRELLLPLVRADYEVIESYDPGSRPPSVESAVSVFRGADDDIAGDQAEAWRELTAAGALGSHRVFPGGHFYLREHHADVLSAIVDEIDSLSVRRNS